MRKLKIDLAELEMAFDSGQNMIAYYLDLETGEIYVVAEETSALLESLTEAYYDAATQSMDWEAAFEEENVRDWQQQAVQEADRSEADCGTRFITIPTDSSREGYQNMEAFIAEVSDPHLQSQLERAIDGRGAFRRFKNVLDDYPTEREQWYQFKRERLRQRMLEWLESQEIIPDW
jgi:hypothetical protein